MESQSAKGEQGTDISQEKEGRQSPEERGCSQVLIYGGQEGTD